MHNEDRKICNFIGPWQKKIVGSGVFKQLIQVNHRKSGYTCEPLATPKLPTMNRENDESNTWLLQGKGASWCQKHKAELFRFNESYDNQDGSYLTSMTVRQARLQSW